jgi:ElaB/YqjD/DUF883 family membrane-anchored ribosome-binding protein
MTTPSTIPRPSDPLNDLAMPSVTSASSPQRLGQDGYRTELDEARRSATQALSSARESLEHGVNAARLRADDLRTELASHTEAVRDRASELGREAQHRITTGVQQGRRRAATAIDDCRRYTRENPGRVIAGSLLAGFAAGWMLTANHRRH